MDRMNITPYLAKRNIAPTEVFSKLIDNEKEF